jgi:hypothetical protein
MNIATNKFREGPFPYIMVLARAWYLRDGGRGVSRTQSKRGLKKEREGVSRCIRRERRCITTFVTTVLSDRKCTAGSRLISYRRLASLIATSRMMLRNCELERSC